jgi:hypothetical protein
VTRASTIATCIILTITTSVYCQTAVEKKEPLSAKAITALVPKKIINYTSKGAPKSSKLSVGKLTYSLCQRDFTSRQKHVQFLLFDYNGAEIMYAQAMRKWGEMKDVSNDSVYFQKDSNADRNTFESYFSRYKHSQIVMGINNRFFLTVTGNKIELEELRLILSHFEFEKFPK